MKSSKLVWTFFTFFIWNFKWNLLVSELFGYNAGANRPKLDAWLKKVREAANPSYDEAHSFVKKMSKL